jgi:hypothetical protein
MTKPKIKNTDDLQDAKVSTPAPAPAPDDQTSPGQQRAENAEEDTPAERAVKEGRSPDGGPGSELSTKEPGQAGSVRPDLDDLPQFTKQPNEEHRPVPPFTIPQPYVNTADNGPDDAMRETEQRIESGEFSKSSEEDDDELDEDDLENPDLADDTDEEEDES